MMKRLWGTIVCLLLCASGASRLAHAAATRFSVLNFYPVQSTGTWQFVYESQHGTDPIVSVGTALTYGNRVLEERSSTRRVINHLFVQYLITDLRLSRWLSGGVTFPMLWRLQFQDPAPLTAPGYQLKTRPGDLQFRLQARLVNRRFAPVGLGLVGFLTVPTGAESFYVGDEMVSGGGFFTLDTERWDRVMFGVNLGVEFRRPIDFRNIQIGTMSLLYRAGVAVDLTPTLDASIELMGRSPLRRLFQERAEGPMECLGFLHITPTPHVTLRIGGGGGVIHGTGSPQYRAVTSLAYHW
ncbi:MAG: hypothetical protein HYV02_02260 [Deltaproteobacteria bacterium]|nr:hypothetical protein [Deltaproteobacteria bacterium]